MADFSVSELKFKMNDFLLDSLGLDADIYTDSIDAARDLKDLNLVISSVYAKIKVTQPNTALKFFELWTKLTS